MSDKKNLPPQRNLYLFIIRYQGLLAISFSLILMAWFVYLQSRESQGIQRIEHITNEVSELNPKTASFTLPDELTFAGEPVPLKDPEVYRRVDRELHRVIYFHSSTLIILKRSHVWYPDFERILQAHGVPEDFKYLVPVESKFRNVVSHKGAAGFWQFMPHTGREYGLRIDREVDERYNPYKAAHAACELLKYLKNKLGTWTAATAAYNMGYYALRKQIRRQGTKNYFELYLNSETRRYIPRILAFKLLMEDPEGYGYALAEPAYYSKEPTYSLTIDHSIQDLREFCKALGISYKTLKYHNPWLLRNSLTIKEKGKTYDIKVPKETVIDGQVVRVRIPPAFRSS